MASNGSMAPERGGSLRSSSGGCSLRYFMSDDEYYHGVDSVPEKWRDNSQMVDISESEHSSENRLMHDR